MKAQGRPLKKKIKNISGLQNQSKTSPSPSDTSSNLPASIIDQQIVSPVEEFHTVVDNTRVNWEEEEEAPTDSDDDEEMEFDVWDDEDLATRLVELTEKVESDKKTFQQAKDAALQYLNGCPVEVIRRFMNRSWCFMSAYQLGLTGKAAEWAVRCQMAHRSMS
jgi:hypothetical protein